MYLYIILARYLFKIGSNPRQILTRLKEMMMTYRESRRNERLESQNGRKGKIGHRVIEREDLRQSVSELGIRAKCLSKYIFPQTSSLWEWGKYQWPFHSKLCSSNKFLLGEIEKKVTQAGPSPLVEVVREFYSNSSPFNLEGYNLSYVLRGSNTCPRS